MRVALPGTQVLFAFLLTVPFSARFDRTTAFQKDVFFATLLGAALGTALLLTPAALHRMLFQRGEKAHIVRVAHLMTVSALGVLAVTVSGVILLITSLLFTVTAAWIVASMVFLVFGFLWFVLPLGPRIRGPRRNGR